MTEPNYSIVPMDKVAVGTRLVTDDGFTCMDDHEHKVVLADDDGALYVECREGHHDLDGQECGPEEHDAGFDHYIGFWLEGTEPPVDPDAEGQPKEPSTAASDARRGEPTDDLGESPDF